MGRTGVRDVHFDKPLSNMAIAYRPEGMIADLVAPILNVNKQSDGYYIWDKADAFRIENSDRAPGTEANIITRSVDTSTYFAKNYALKDRIPYEDLENADAGYVFTERANRVEYVKDKLMLDWEVRLASQVTSTSNVGSSSAVSSAWTTATTGNSDPIGDIRTGITNVQDSTGYLANSILFGIQAWRNFREHADVIDRIYGSMGSGKGARIVNMIQTAALFEIDRVNVGGAYRNTADEGQTVSLSSIWADHVLVYYAPLKPRKDKPSFMYAFRWNKVQNMNVEIHQDSKAKAEEVEVGYYQEEKITASDLSFLITNVTSST